MKLGASFWVGLIAAICIAIYMMPQLIKVVKTKDTTSISTAMFCIALIGNLLFVVDGIIILATVVDIQGKEILLSTRLSNGLPILLANAFAFFISFGIAFYKFRNVKWAKKYGVNEADIAKNYNKYLKLHKEEKAKKKAEKEAKATQSSQTTQPKDGTTIG